MLLSGALPRGVQAHRCQDWAAPTHRARMGGEGVAQAGLCLRGGRRGRGGRCRATQVSVPPEQLDVPRGETAGAAFLLEAVTVQARPALHGGLLRGTACEQRRALSWTGGRQAGDRDLLVDVDWTAMPGHRVGLVGANGALRPRSLPQQQGTAGADCPLTLALPRRLRQEHAAAVPDRPAQRACPRPRVRCSVRRRAMLPRNGAGRGQVNGGRLLVGSAVEVGYLEQTAVSGSGRTVWAEVRSRMTRLVAAEAALEAAGQAAAGGARPWPPPLASLSEKVCAGAA